MNTAPAFNRGYRLHHDRVRGTTVILAPERLITLSEASIAVLELVDGTRMISEIVVALAARFSAPIEIIETDVVALLRGLQGEGAIRL